MRKTLAVLFRACSVVLLCAAVAPSSVHAVPPSSANYALPSTAVNNGVGDMASASYKLSSSLGDTTFTERQTSAGFVLSPGFWHSVIGVTQGCVLDVDGNQSISATTDGLMLLRAMLGLTGPAGEDGNRQIHQSCATIFVPS